MNNNILYSLEDILNKGIKDTNGAMLPVKSIIIPKIQRSYAQGRASESHIRNRFLNSIFSSLDSIKILELSFVYGTLNDDGDLILLDGQQRLTTLYLLYWYIAKREGVVLPDYMSHFVYETRHTSTDFLHNILSLPITLNPTTPPSISISNNTWFTVAYEKDPTVDSMLRMLDCIHEHYNKLFSSKYGSTSEEEQPGHLNLYPRLGNLMFYVLPLKKFGLTDELYIKMNARGLFLVPFENFKADLVKYLRQCKQKPKNTYKIDNATVPFNQYFPIKLDNTYVNLFWNRNDPNAKKIYHLKYFRFFYRYMGAMLSWNFTISADAFTKSPSFVFFENEPEEKQDAKYFGFDCFKQNLDISILEDINHVLDLLTKTYPVIKQIMTNPWDGEWDLFEESSKFQRTHKVAFAAVMDYLRTVNQVDKDQFRRWMRVVWNVIENSNIDGPVPQVNTIRTLHNLNNLISVDASHDVHGVLSKYQITNGTPRALREEASKAKKIVSDPSEDWENVFIKAESHPFFKGMIGFFFTDNMSLQEFKHRYDIVSQMFDVNGIVNSLRKEHLQIRAMISCLNSWKDLNELSFTERKESGNFLKLMLASKKNISDFFCTMLDQAKCFADVPKLLESKIKNTYPNFKDDQGKPDRNLNLAFERLVHDVNMYNWIASVEQEHYNWSFRIYWTLGHYFVAVPRKWYARMVIDTDRNFIIPMLVHKFGFEFEDSNEIALFENYHDFFGNDVNLVKTMQQPINKYKLRIAFSWDHIVRYSIYSATGTDLASILNIITSHPAPDNIPNAHMVDDQIILGEGRYYSISSFPTIEKQFEGYLNILQKILP